MPPIPPPMPPAGAGVSFLGASTTMASLVVKRLLTLAASESAVRTTCKATLSYVNTDPRVHRALLTSAVLEIDHWIYNTKKTPFSTSQPDH